MNRPISTNATPALEPDPSPSTQRSPLTSRQRWISLAEFLVGGAIVIAYNVFHVIPNEVPILFVLGMVSLRLRDGGWSAMGLRWPVALRNTVLIALAAAATRILLGALVVDPLSARFWPAAAGPSGFDEIAGHPWVALRWLGIVWTFAAFGEEISYRGYLLTRASDVGARTRLADWIAVLLVAILFGVGHYYKGAAGMVDSGMAGFVLGGAFLLSGRNLWVCILAHGFIDSFGVLALYFGWSS